MIISHRPDRFFKTVNINEMTFSGLIFKMCFNTNFINVGSELPSYKTVHSHLIQGASLMIKKSRPDAIPRTFHPALVTGPDHHWTSSLIDRSGMDKMSNIRAAKRKMIGDS